jgi:hypothetical protein
MDKITSSEVKVEDLKRKGKVACTIAVGAAIKQMGDKSTVQWALGVGVIQGLKYSGSIKRGVKAGLATYGAFAGANAVMNIARSWDVIKKS